jgi:rod shape-determining protein MreC
MFVRVMGLPLRFALYVLASLVLMGVDARYDTLHLLRSGLAALLHPVQAGLARPFHYLQDAFAFFEVHGQLVRENHRLRQAQQELMQRLHDRALLQAENAQLRRLLGLAAPPGYTGHGVEIVQAMTNPFERKVVVDRGSLQGLSTGWPAVDDQGLVGQVTRVYPTSSEITLISSSEQDVPVQVLRNGLRLIVSGTGQDRLLEVRFLDMHADLQPGDLLVTSGLDGVYPPGIPVARVVAVEPPRHTPFARAVCTAVAGVGRHRQLLVLQRESPATAAAPTDTALRQATPARRGPSP